MTDYEEIRQWGYRRGYTIASWQDMPEYGDELSREIDWIGIRQIETRDDLFEAVEMMAHQAEENDRQFTPFEFTIKELNEMEFPNEAWEEFEEGIIEGV